jgi:DNA adenine methylase
MGRTTTLKRRPRIESSVANIPPPFCRQGNKYPMREEIIRLIPKNHKVYVEPFVGSGAIFYNKPPAEETILNDLDEDTYQQHRLLKNAPIAARSYPTGLDTIPDIKQFYGKTPKTAAEKLIHAKIESCNGFSGSPVKASYGIYRKADPVKILKHIRHYKELLNRNTRILNEDYGEVVRTYDSADTFFFFDPPYENTRSIYGYGEHKGFDFDRLLAVLKGIRGRFLMTINDSPRMRKLFGEFTVVPTKVYARWSRKTKRANARKELIVLNYSV